MNYEKKQNMMKNGEKFKRKERNILKNEEKNDEKVKKIKPKTKKFNGTSNKGYHLKYTSPQCHR